jgi:ParB family chromosome partitioning protein
MVAYRLVDLVGRASAANILGITVRELDKLIDVFELSERFTALRDPGAAITWARELMGVSKKLLTPSVIDAVVEKVNQKRITNSKDLRKLRAIIPDPVARAPVLTSSMMMAISTRPCFASGRRKRKGPTASPAISMPLSRR